MERMNASELAEVIIETAKVHGDMTCALHDAFNRSWWFDVGIVSMVVQQDEYYDRDEWHVVVVHDEYERCAVNAPTKKALYAQVARDCRVDFLRDVVKAMRTGLFSKRR